MKKILFSLALIFGALTDSNALVRIGANSGAGSSSINRLTPSDVLLSTNPTTNITSGGIIYTVTSPTTVKVGSNPGASGEIVIPATVTTDFGTYSVTSIGNNAFFSCTSLTSVTIPNSVTSIGTQAFSSCTNLTAVTIPNSVTNIGTFAFFQSGLTSVIISNSLTNISQNTFAYCTNLTSVTVPNSVTNIGVQAFAFCTNLTSVTIGNSVSIIGINAFNGCSSLTTVTIPNSVTNISNYAFENCTSLTSVTIGNSVTNIGYQAFSECTNLTSVICNVTIPITISENVFQYVNQAACSLTVPVGSIAAYQAAAVWKNFAPIFSLSKVIDSQCGATLSALNTVIRAKAITGVSRYKFKVVHGTTTQIIEPTSERWFRLTSLPGGPFFNTTYTISVAVKKNNVWSDFGDECSVTTPTAPLSKLIDRQCGTTLASINTYISPYRLWNNTGFRYKVVNGASTQTI